MYPPPPAAPNSYAPQLRPLGIGETLDAAIKIFTRNFKALVLCAAVVVVPLQILAALVRLSALPDVATTTTTTNGTTTSVDTGALGLQFAASLVTLAVLLLAQFLATAVCMKASSDAYLGQKATASSSLRFAARRLPSLLWLGLLVWVPIYLGFGLCLAPGLWLLASWAVAVPALLIEGARGTKAIGRSWTLVRGRRWPILGVLLLAYLLSSILGAILGVGVLAASGFSTSSATYVALSTISSAITTSLTVPIYATIVALIYFDLRVRHEGFDLALLAQQVGVATPAGGFVGGFVGAPAAAPVQGWSAPPQWGAVASTQWNPPPGPSPWSDTPPAAPPDPSNQPPDPGDHPPAE
jgi:hypothetical protein